MGCTTSRHPSARDAPHLPSISVPAHSGKFSEGDENFKDTSWKSKASSMPKSKMTDNDHRSIPGISGKESGLISQMKPFSKLRSVEEEDSGLDFEESETVATHLGFKDGFGDGKSNMPSTLEARKRRLSEQTVSLHPERVVKTELGFPVLQQCFTEDEFGREKPSLLDRGFASTAKLCVSSFRSFSCRKSIDDAGLKLLLSPVVSPPQSFICPSKGLTLTRSLSSNGRFNPRIDDDFCVLPRALDIPRILPSGPEWMSTEDDSPDPNSPLFDPSILATFEKAVEAVSDDNWQSSDVSPSSSSERVSSSSETWSDADSPELPRAGGGDVGRSKILSTLSRWEEISCKGGEINASPCMAESCRKKRMCFSIVSPLERFETKCPPAGEGKIVLYFTSLRGIRKTYEDCCTLRTILEEFKVHVDERDVWMHSKFRQELTNVMGEAVSVPRLFLKGRYIGGVEEVKQLHDEGILGSLFEGLPNECKQVCDVCAGVRFIPCTSCNGSCKMISEDDKKLRCPDCNENGLIMCPWCEW